MFQSFLIISPEQVSTQERCKRKMDALNVGGHPRKIDSGSVSSSRHPPFPGRPGPVAPPKAEERPAMYVIRAERS